MGNSSTRDASFSFVEPLRINANLVIPSDEISAQAVRGGGPGGQNVNKVATKVVLSFSVANSRSLGERRKATLLRRLGARLTASGKIVIHAGRHRDRLTNLEDARDRLAAILREGLRPERRRVATKPTHGSRQRRLSEKRQHGEIKRSRGRRSFED